MLNAKFLFLTFLVLAANTLAARLTYVCRFEGGKVSDASKKHAEIDDSKAESIISGMSSWSGGKYKVSKHARTGIIIIAANTRAASQGAATDVVQNMQSLVAQNARAKSPTPGPSTEEGGAKSAKGSLKLSSPSGSSRGHRRRAALNDVGEDMWARSEDYDDLLWARSDDFDDIWTRSDNYEGLFDHID